MNDVSSALSAGNSSALDFVPTGHEVKSIRAPCLFMASSFIVPRKVRTSRMRKAEMSEIPNRKNRGQRNFLCPLFIPIPHRSCSCLKAIAVRDHHAVRTSGAMHRQQAAQPAVACGDADVFILRIEQQAPPAAPRPIQRPCSWRAAPWLRHPRRG